MYHGRILTVNFNVLLINCSQFVTAHGRRKTVGELANPDKVHRTFKASKDRPFAGIYTWHGADGALYGMGVVYAGVVDLNS